MKKRAEKKKESVKSTILKFLILCWLLPMLLMMGVTIRYLFGNHFSQSVDSFVEQLEYNNQLCVERLNSAVADSRDASYDGTIGETWSAYQKGEHGEYEVFRDWDKYMVQKYQRNSAFAATILWGWEDPEKWNRSVYNETANGRYQDVRTYWEQDHEAVLQEAAVLDTRVGFVRCQNRLYLVRNLMNSSYEPVAALVMRLSRFYCFGNLENIPMAQGMTVELNGLPFLETEADNPQILESVFEKAKEETKGYEWEKGRLYIYKKNTGNGYSLRTILEIDNKSLLVPFYGWQYVFAGMAVCFIPLLFLMMHQFQRRVADPVNELMRGFAQLEQEKLGYQITEESLSLEFQYLKDSFNQMSLQMKQYFNRIYEEEIALKDARIMALQSHINPHFMNNTLEIINWEARLGGNEKVSKMIQALSTLMDAAMDRKKKPQVRLAEEMMYVNSYLYITKERLGKRLTIEMDIPEELSDCLVPRLILQPLIENAVEHGVAPRSSGRVTIRGRKEEGFLIMEIENDGTLSREDEERIRRLLDGNYDTSREPSGNLGIANVNQRLRILYGPPCGLTVFETEEGAVVSRILIRLPEKEET